MKLFLFSLCGLFWGGSYIAIKVAVGDMAPMHAALYRVLAALIFLSGFYAWRKKPYAVPRVVRTRVWIAGLFAHGLPFALLFYGEQRISAGLGGILNGTVPLWTFVFSLFFLKQHEPLTGRRILGLLLGIMGLGVIFLPSIEVKGSHDELIGILSLTAMAASYGVGMILNRKIFLHASKVSLHACLYQQLLSSSLFLIVASGFYEGPPSFSWTGHLTSWLAILYMGWISSAIAFIIFYWLLMDWGAVKTSAVTYLVPPFALLLDFFFNGTVPIASEILGTLIVLTGVVLIQWSPKRRSGK